MPARSDPAVRFVGVRGRRSRSPSVIATVDGWAVVTWRTSGWACTCDDDDCGHVDAVAALLDPRVTGEDRPTPDRGGRADRDRGDRPATGDAASAPQPSERVPPDQRHRANPARPTLTRSSARPGTDERPSDPGEDPLSPGSPRLTGGSAARAPYEFRGSRRECTAGAPTSIDSPAVLRALPSPAHHEGNESA